MGGTGTCANLMNNYANCGACDDACMGTEQCIGGTCMASTCTTPCMQGTETCVSGACVACGQEVGQPCCVLNLGGGGPIYACPDQPDLVQCNQTTHICE